MVCMDGMSVVVKSCWWDQMKAETAVRVLADLVWSFSETYESLKCGENHDPLQEFQRGGWQFVFLKDSAQ